MKFEVGEFAIVVSAPAYQHVVGRMVCVMEIDECYRSPYRLDLTIDGLHTWAADNNLRKLLPPREEPESLVRKLECEA